MNVPPETNAISFARKIPSPDMFPLAQLRESARHAIEHGGRVTLNCAARRLRPRCANGSASDTPSNRRGSS